MNSLLLLLAAATLEPTTITILHTNDLHAHPLPSAIAQMQYGGYARQAELIKKFRSNDPNVILLNAGDTFQGTLFYQTFEGLAEAAFMNSVRYDAMCVGNHEFDNGPGRLGQFARFANFPLLAANLDVSAEPELKGRIGATAVVKSGSVEVGIVGAVTPDTPNISSPGPNVKFLDLVSSVQKGIDDLEKRGINRIILLTHIGYREDRELARRIRGADVIVGGHSHSALGTPALPGWPTPAGPYPTVEKDLDGQSVYIVQGYEWGKVLGRLKVHFDASGKVTHVSEAAPVVIDASVPEEPVVASLIEAFKKPVANLADQPVGSASAEITRGGANPVASIITDAMLQATVKHGATAAFVNAGGVRAGFDQGDITYGEAIAVQPFANSLVVLELTGEELKRVLEDGVANAQKTGGLLYPSAGTSYSVDLRKPSGARVSDLVVAGKPLDPKGTYLIATPTFSASGGDFHTTLKEAKGRRVDTGIVDIDALIAYIKSHSPLSPNSTVRVLRSGG